MENQHISNHDKAVLTRIFNPNLPYGDTYDEDEQLEEAFEEEIETAEVLEAKRLEVEGVKGALADLDKAIQLCEGHGKVACQAYTQRGLIKRLQEDDCGAKEDLTHAAHLGGQFAKHLLVAMNPYAALCNQMLADVMGRLRAGEEQMD
ncbi:TTC36-like protein [Mya arenaria]|uniref:TTC36-like protein n=1 Tax=Mya arenaria TaxID=6604 RepID=A0ABY7EZU0_MYAAR|nr:TTC36-like protein [Mya arenaria]